MAKDEAGGGERFEARQQWILAPDFDRSY